MTSALPVDVINVSHLKRAADMTVESGGRLSVLRLGARALRRDLRNPHLLAVALALIIATAGMTAVAMFTDRIQRGLTEQASQLLAADLALVASRPLPTTVVSEAKSAHLRTSHQASLRSMVSHADGLQMVELKAVDAAYPLRGNLQMALRDDSRPQIVQQGPPPGEVWVETRLLALLGVEVGASIKLGQVALRIGGVLVLEPDRAGDLFSIAPRVMMSLNDLPATGLVLPGSRVQYGLLVAGERTALDGFAKSAREAASKGEFRVISPDDARPEIRSALDHARQFLGLAALVATTLAGLAILVAAHSFARQQVDAIAVWRTLGAQRSTLAWVLGVELGLLGLGAAALGCGVGALLERGLASLLGGVLQGALPKPGPWPVLRSGGAGVAALMGFALPQLLALRGVSPARVLRRDLPWKGPSAGAILGGGLASLALLTPWDSGQRVITLYALGGLAASLLGLFLAGHGALWLLAQWIRLRPSWWAAGLTPLTRRPGLAALQICALGLSLMAIQLLGFVRTDLVTRWTSSLPADAPDQFLINIAPADIPALENFLAARAINTGGFFPMVRARLVSINDHPVAPEKFPDPRARRLAEREFNLSTAVRLKPDNRVTAGQFWSETPAPNQFSFEEEIAQSLGLGLGDRITYRVADRIISGEITSLRAVNWETMEANFFVVAPPALLADQPATYITSFRLPPDKPEVLRELVREFPSLTVIDVMAMIGQLRGVMQKSLSAIEFVFFFTLAASIVVIFSAVQATHGERLHDVTILKTLGATRTRILGISSLEFLGLGVVAGGIGSLAATLGAWTLAARVMHLDYVPDPELIVGSAITGAVLVWLAGLRAIIATWCQPVAQVLREWS
jgi:putative ABC transport system permease protein